MFDMEIMQIKNIDISFLLSPEGDWKLDGGEKWKLTHEGSYESKTSGSELT